MSHLGVPLLPFQCLHPGGMFPLNKDMRQHCGPCRSKGSVLKAIVPAIYEQGSLEPCWYTHYLRSSNGCLQLIGKDVQMVTAMLMSKRCMTNF